MLNTTTLVAVSLPLAAALTGCGEEPIPASPSFATDVRPILISRCVRCHGAGGELNDDPSGEKGLKPGYAYLEHYDDVGACGPMDPLVGCQERGAGQFADAIVDYITETNPRGRMPPPPASPLDDYQIEIITRWAAAPRP